MEIKYQYWLSNIPGVGNRKIEKILQRVGTAEELYFLGEKQLMTLTEIGDKEKAAILSSRKSWKLDEEYEKLCGRGIIFLSQEMSNFPVALKNMQDSPYSIYVKGKLPGNNRKKVAIVGARMCSEYGRVMALEIGKKLAEYQVEVISGMARGVDSFGHLGAIKGGGDTFAVLGCGVDVCYPQSNQRLYQDILDHGGIISEYPPGTVPMPQLFPARNRIISALSDVIVVIEAKARSGSLITADFALEQGKDVFALPGRISDPLSEGCNYLIKQGAGIIVSPEEFLKDLELCPNNTEFQEDLKKLLLEKDESLVYSCVDLRPKSIQELMCNTGFELKKLADLLQNMIQKELIVETFKNYYIRKT